MQKLILEVVLIFEFANTVRQGFSARIPGMLAKNKNQCKTQV